MKYCQSQTQALVPSFCKQLISLHPDRDSTAPLVDDRDDHKTSDFFSMQSTQIIDIHLPTTLHCVWAACAFLQAEISRSIWLSGFPFVTLTLGRNDSTCIFICSMTRCKVSASFRTTTVSVLPSAFTACQQISRWHSQNGCSLHATTSWCHLKTMQFNY